MRFGPGRTTEILTAWRAENERFAAGDWRCAATDGMACDARVAGLIAPSAKTPAHPQPACQAAG